MRVSCEICPMASKELEGWRSVPYKEVLRVMELVAKLYPYILLHFLLENVDSAPAQVLEIINRELGIALWRLCSSHLSHIRRPRL